MHKTLFNFLELSMFIYLKYISNEVDKGLGHGKKKFIYHLNYHGRLKIMIYSNTCREQNLY